MDPVKVAVVTGRHPFDARGFVRLFRSLDGVDAYLQHMEEFSADPAGLRDWYDAVLFYNMHMDTPTGDGAWYDAGIKGALERIGETSQGVVVLHHAILAFPQWRPWQDLVGIEDRSFGYYIGETIRVEVANAGHPFTQGLSDWDMIDETYTMSDPGDDSEILLTTDHPRSMNALAWTRRYGNAPVFCFQSGHDDRTWVNANFREVLRRGLLWCAGRL